MAGRKNTTTTTATTVNPGSINRVADHQTGLLAPPAKSEPASSAKPAPQNQKPAPAAPTHEQIARRAYEIFLARGGHHGRAADDWAQAERELRGRQSSHLN